MGEVDKLTSQLLEISKQLASSSKSFKFTLKTKDISFSFCSKDRDLPSEDAEKNKRKSPSQKNRDFKRRKHFLEKKLDESNSANKPCEKDSADNKVIVERQDDQFKCEECEYSTSSNKGLQIHIGKQHKISGQIDGIDDIELKEDKKQEYTESETQTDSPFQCGKFCEEIFDDKNAWKMHMLKEHLDSVKIISKRHSRFLWEALEYKSYISQTRDPDILRFLETYQEL